MGALSWWVEDGRSGELDLSGFAAVLVYRYDDDEPGSPWSFTLHLDRASTTAADTRRRTVAHVAAVFASGS